jgi:hypothetical protein
MSSSSLVVVRQRLLAMEFPLLLCWRLTTSCKCNSLLFLRLLFISFSHPHSRPGDVCSPLRPKFVQFLQWSLWYDWPLYLVQFAEISELLGTAGPRPEFVQFLQSSVWYERPLFLVHLAQMNVFLGTAGARPKIVEFLHWSLWYDRPLFLVPFSRKEVC